MPKVRPPVLPGGTVRRPRVERAIAACARGHPIVVVVAVAGAGKTTAVTQYVADAGRPVAWLSLDERERRQGRFVSFLSAALEPLDPVHSSNVLHLLEDGLPADDCAAMLAEGLPPRALVVLDDVHEIEAGTGALRALRAFLRFLPPGRGVVLVSRRVPQLGLERDALASRVAGVFDRDLAFTVEETATLLSARGVDRDPVVAHSATGGWAAALVFDALPQEGDAAVLPPGEDLLFAYMAAEILDRLPRHLRSTLPRTAVLDVMTPTRLVALLDDSRAGGLFDEISRLHLPVTAEADSLRYHSRFRAFLLHRLRSEHPEEVSELTARFARVMAAEGHPEEAVDALLAAGRPSEAEALAERAVEQLMRRGDWEKALAWSVALGEDAHRRRGALRRAQLRSLLLSRRQQEVEDLVHVMLASGEIGRLAVEDPDTVCWAVWALHGSGEWAKLLPLLPCGSSPRTRVVGHLFATSAAPEPPPELPADMFDRPQPLHVALQSALYYQGRFAEIERLAAAARSRGPVTAALAQIYRIAVMRERGDLPAARRALEAVAQRVRASRYREYWHQVEGELLFEEGARDEGLELLREARRVSREHSYRIGDRALFAAGEGKMLVRTGRADEARRVLTDAAAWCAERGLLSFREWADTWLGASLLAHGEPPGRALAVLRPAVAGMRRAGRLLELPAAAAFLAEAEWRDGDEDAHDAAITVGYEAAEAMGSLAPLLRALALVPDVLLRRADAAPEDDHRWRRLLRAARDRPVPHTAEAPRVRVRTFGGASIEVDGRTPPVRATRMVELAARLARGGEAGVSRDRLVADLFEGSDDGPNYLRQVVHRLRRLLPEGVELVSREGRLAWMPAAVVDADDAAFEALVARARLEVGAGRLEALRRALRLYERGPYMPGVDGGATAARRRELDELATEARIERIRALLVAGESATAREAARSAVVVEPYSEETWQLLMRAEAALAGAGSVASVLLECQEALREIGLEPCGATLRLVERLRA